MTIEVPYAIKLAASFLFGAFVLNVARVFYSTILRTRWYLRHVPTVEDFDKDPVIPSTDSDPLSKFRDVNRGCSSGPVVRYPSLLSPPILTIANKLALSDVLLSRPYSFPKPTNVIGRQVLGATLEKGILFVERDDHRRQRKIMSPSFGLAHMKSLHPIFIDKAHNLRDSLLRTITGINPSPTVNIHAYMECVALDIIAAAGFGYEVNSLGEGPETPLFTAFHQVFAGKNHRFSTLLPLISQFIPFRILDFSSSARELRGAAAAVTHIGHGLVDEKKKMVIDSTSADKPAGIDDLAGRDLLSVLEIISFFLAGRGTVSTAISWTIHGLCENPDFQRKLRAERGAPIDPVAFRSIAEDTVLPLSKPYVDKVGKKQTSIFVPRNTLVYVPILEMNRNVDVWGPDATSFNPERWLKSKVPDGALEMPSIAMPAFLAGPRGCMGFRFALIEMKAVLFTLVKTFQFQLGVPRSEIEGDNRLPSLIRPKLKGKPELGWQMPVIISRVEDDS